MWGPNVPFCPQGPGVKRQPGPGPRSWREKGLMLVSRSQALGKAGFGGDRARPDEGDPWKRTLPILFIALTIVLVVGCQGAPAPVPAEQGQSQVARGEHLTLILGCHDCPTPKIMGANGPEPDMSKRLIGHPEGSNLPAAPTLPAGPWRSSRSCGPFPR